MLTSDTYQIKLQHFEGPFDLLLFFIERDELDIKDIPIAKIINDFLQYIDEMEQYNITLASEFILFAAILMKIKAKMIIPRKEKDEAGNEIDPREEITAQLIAYKKYKEVAVELAKLETQRMLSVKRGNRLSDYNDIGKKVAEGADFKNLSIYQLMKAFEKVQKKMQERLHQSRHIVHPYNYTMEESRTQILDRAQQERSLTFEKIFDVCKDGMHAVFLFLSLLELIQQQFLYIIVGVGNNNFVVEYVEKIYET